MTSEIAFALATPFELQHRHRGKHKVAEDDESALGTVWGGMLAVVVEGLFWNLAHHVFGINSVQILLFSAHHRRPPAPEVAEGNECDDNDRNERRDKHSVVVAAEALEVDTSRADT